MDMIFKAYAKLKDLFIFWKKAEKEKDTSSPEPERDKKVDPSAKTDFNKEMEGAYKKLQDDIFNEQRTIYEKKPG